MRNLLALILVGSFFVIGCGGKSVSDLCEEQIENMCELSHECADAEEKEDEFFQAVWGIDVDDCVEMREEGRTTDVNGFEITVDAENCAEQNEENACPEGHEYDQDKAEECVDALGALTCDDIEDGMFDVPSVCLEVCVEAAE